MMQAWLWTRVEKITIKAFFIIKITRHSWNLSNASDAPKEFLHDLLPGVCLWSWELAEFLFLWLGRTGVEFTPPQDWTGKCSSLWKPENFWVSFFKKSWIDSCLEMPQRTPQLKPSWQTPPRPSLGPQTSAILKILDNPSTAETRRAPATFDGGEAGVYFCVSL